MAGRDPGGSGACDLGSALRTSTRIDGFYGGRFHLVQPVGTGYRAGLDALLLAATVPENAAGRLADVGSGAGAVGFAAASRAGALSVTLLENEPTMVRCARAGLTLETNAGLAGRIGLIEADILTARPPWDEAQSTRQAFDFVLTNPPFYLPGHRVSPDPLRQSALHAPSADFLERWLKASIAALKDGGRFAAVLPPPALPIALAALKARLGGPVVTPIHPKTDDPASRLIVTGRKGSREPFSLLAPQVLFTAEGAPSQFSASISNGTAFLGWSRPDRGHRR